MQYLPIITVKKAICLEDEFIENQKLIIRCTKYSMEGSAKTCAIAFDWTLDEAEGIRGSW